MNLYLCNEYIYIEFAFKVIQFDLPGGELMHFVFFLLICIL